MDENTYIKACQRGEKESFEPLFQMYCRKAYFTALAITGNPEDALDVSQDAFIKAYRNINRFDNTRSFYPWFYQILKNCCYTFMGRKRKVSGEVPESGDRHLDPALLVEQDEKNTMILDKINELPTEEREILQMKYIEGLRYAEISEILCIPTGTVMSRLYRARSLVKEKLANWLREETKDELPRN